MKYSLRSLLIFMTLAGCSPAIVFWLLKIPFESLLLPFAIVLVVSLLISLREFAKDGRSDPPNFS